MVYAPQIVFLNCDGSSALPRGSWYHYSYGTIATYKQDWDNFGGFSKDFLNKITWGGEDWDIIDGAVKGGLEIERKRSPWIYHYYHSKKGMWQKKNVNKTALAKGNPKTGLAAKKLPPMVKSPPKKEISTKTKGVAQNKATPLHRDRNPQNKVTSHQTLVSSGKQAHLQAVGNSPKEFAAQKGLSQKKVPIQNKALNKKDTNQQKDISRPRQAILQKENHSPKENSPKNKDLPNVKTPLHENVESQNNVHNQKQPHDWKDGSHEKELLANRNIISPKKVLPQKKHVDHPKQTYKQTSQKQAHKQQKIVSPKKVQLQH